MKFGYSNGHVAGFTAASEIYERQIAILREELADTRAALADEKLRAEGAVDQLLLRIGARAIGPSTIANDEKRVEKHEARMQDMMLAGDPTADRPLGTPGSEFDSLDDPRASLFYDMNNLTEQ